MDGGEILWCLKDKPRKLNISKTEKIMSVIALLDRTESSIENKKHVIKI